MKRFKLSPEAAADIRSIWAFIAKDNIRAARRVRIKIFDACKRIAEHPRIGHRREDLTVKPLLFWPVDSYLIVYTTTRSSVEIVRVLHGALDIPVLLMTT
jgi:plasmid stabilization system protein ParE